jgi:hypothetical protein
MGWGFSVAATNPPGAKSAARRLDRARAQIADRMADGRSPIRARPSRDRARDRRSVAVRASKGRQSRLGYGNLQRELRPVSHEPPNFFRSVCIFPIAYILRLWENGSSAQGNPALADRN